MRGISRCAGDVLNGRYEIVERISHGPMSRIHKAWDRRDRRFVAVKMAFGRDHDSNVERLQREGLVLATLRHPRILRAFDSGPVEPDGYHIVADLLEGASLESRLNGGRHLPVREAVEAAAETLEGLEAVHRAGLVHRDVKPGNLMLTPNGAVLIDFGLVTAAPLKRARRLTSPGMAVGTPNYMSPEACLDSQELDGRADLYALGLVLYRMLTGRRAIEGDYSEEVQYAQLELAPRPFALSAPRLRLPKRLEAAVMRSLEKSPADRFASAAEMREAILAAAS
jgi:serine/threonine-protein kinase